MMKYRQKNDNISWENDYLEQQTYHFIPLNPALLWPKLGTDVNSILNPKGGGGGPKVPAGQEIACHFSQDHAMVTKILDFIHKHLN